MLLYHASTTIVAQPRIFRAEVGRDFGFGFYVTPERALAEKWAWQRAAILAAQTGGLTKAIINTYRWAGPEGLQEKDFPTPTQDWWEFVTRARAQTRHEEEYDLVTGPAADGAAGLLMNLSIYGLMPAAQALASLAAAAPGGNQWALCTPAAIARLHYQNSLELRRQTTSAAGPVAAPRGSASDGVPESLVTAQQRRAARACLRAAASEMIAADWGQEAAAAQAAFAASQTSACLDDDSLELDSQSALRLARLFAEEQDFRHMRG